MARGRAVWLIVWLCLDGVVAAPRDAFFLRDTPGDASGGQLQSDPAADSDRRIQMVTDMLVDPAVVSRVLADPSLSRAEREQWEAVQKLAQIYKEHGISEQIGKLWATPGVADTVMALSERFASNANLGQYIENATHALRSPHDTAAAEVLSLLSFAPPPLWAWYNQAQFRGLGRQCSGSCPASIALPDNATLPVACRANTACALQCPDGFKQNPSLSVRCACSEDEPQLAISPPDSTLCIPEGSEPPKRDCGHVGHLRSAAVAYCSNRFMCPLDFDEVCCWALSELRECDDSPFGAVWDNCEYKPVTAGAYFKDKCGPIDGMCPAPEDLAERHMRLDCSLATGNMLYNGMRCATTCEQGYVNANPLAIAAYACDHGVLVIPDLRCVEASCPAPVSLEQGLVFSPFAPCATRGLLLPGEKCSVLCREGLVPARGTAGQAAYVCSEGKMRPPTLQCVEPRCELPAKAPRNAQYTDQCSSSAPLGKGASCQLPCPEGHELINGTAPKLVCGLDLTLSVEGGECKPKGCLLPSSLPSHAKFTTGECAAGHELPSGSECEVVCEPGFEKVVSERHAFACDLGSLDTPHIQCQEASCELPESLHFSMEFKAGNSRCIPHGTIASRQTCELECSEMFVPKGNVVLDVRCFKGKLDLGNSMCEPNEHDPNTAACAHVQSGKCAEDFIECEAQSSHALTAYNTDLVCRCYDEYKACLGSDDACLADAPKGHVANVLHSLCGTGCKQAYKTAFGLCADQSGKCLSDSPVETCCGAAAAAIDACPFTHNQTEVAMLYTSFKNYHCVRPLGNLPEFANTTCRNASVAMTGVALVRGVSALEGEVVQPAMGSRATPALAPSPATARVEAAEVPHTKAVLEPRVALAPNPVALPQQPGKEAAAPSKPPALVAISARANNDPEQSSSDPLAAVKSALAGYNPAFLLVGLVVIGGVAFMLARGSGGDKSKDSADDNDGHKGAEDKHSKRKH